MFYCVQGQKRKNAGRGTVDMAANCGHPPRVGGCIFPDLASLALPVGSPPQGQVGGPGAAGGGGSRRTCHGPLAGGEGCGEIGRRPSNVLAPRKVRWP